MCVRACVRACARVCVHLVGVPADDEDDDDDNKSDVLRTWSLEAADVVGAKSVERLNDGHRDHVLNEIARSLSPQQARRSTQRRRRADVRKHRERATGRRRRATVDVWRDEVQLATAAAATTSVNDNNTSSLVFLPEALCWWA